MLSTRSGARAHAGAGLWLIALAGTAYASPSGAGLDGYRAVEVRANSFLKASQTDGVIAADADGNLVAVWGSRRQEGMNWGIFGQRFDARGNPVGDEFHVNTTAPGMQWQPDVAIGPDGTGWVAWESVAGEPGDVMLRRFSPGFERGDADVRVNVTTEGRQGEVSLAVDGTGRVLACWVSEAGGGTTVRARLFNADGTAASGELPLARGGAWRDTNVSAAFLPDGRFVATWGRADAAGAPVSVIARVFDAGGSAMGDEVVISAAGERSGLPIEPAIAADGAGNFVIAWMAGFGDTHAVHAARFDAAGNVLNAAWEVARADGPGEGWKSGVEVAAHADGRFVIAYNQFDPTKPDPGPNGLDEQRPRHPAAVWARVYDAQGQAQGGAVRVNQYDAFTQALGVDRSTQRAVWTAAGDLAFAWSGRTDDEDSHGVGVTLLTTAPADGSEPAKAERRACILDTTEQEAAFAPPIANPNLSTEPDTSWGLRAGPDFGFKGFDATEWTPPDPDIAVGPNHVVIVVNMKIRYFTKAGVMTFEQDLRNSSGFFGTGAGGFMFDPIAFYDEHAQRFIVGCSQSDSLGEALWVAISDDTDPNGAWRKYRFNTTTTGGFPDFPNIGGDAVAVYYANDYFSSPVGNWITIIEKAAVMNGTTPIVNKVKTASTQVSLGNSKNYDNPATAQYFCRAAGFSGTHNTLIIEAIRNPLGTPTRSTFTLTVPSYSSPSDAPQQGTSSRLDCIDTRIKNGVYRNGSLYVGHGITPSGFSRTLARWYKINMNNWPVSGSPTLADSGNIDAGSGVWTWFPDVTVDANGNMGVVFARSSSSEFAGVARALRHAGDAPGTVRAITTMQSGAAGDSSGRWGDYFGIDNDPVCPGRAWVQGEYRAPSNWATWVGSFYFYSLADYNRNGVIDSTDVVDFLNGFNSLDPRADLNKDGAWNTLDILLFLNVFNNPCGT